jgi:putative transposase
MSTRRLEGLVHQLGLESISKSQVSELAKSLDANVEAFRSRPLNAGPYTPSLAIWTLLSFPRP